VLERFPGNGGLTPKLGNSVRLISATWQGFDKQGSSGYTTGNLKFAAKEKK
jgi:hypothetical protein